MSASNGKAETQPGDERDEQGNYLGKSGSSSEHRTVGDYRAWCHDCGEWCYPSTPCGESKCCAALAAQPSTDQPDSGQDEGLRQRIQALADDLDRMFRSAGADEPRGSRTREFATSTGIGYRRAALRIRDVLAGGDGSLYYGALPWLRPAASDQAAVGESQWDDATMTTHVVVVSHADEILEVWTENDYGLLSHEHATELADWANAQPGNDRLHQAVAVTVPTSERMGR